MRHNLLRDFEIQTSHLISIRRPDQEEREPSADFAIPADDRVKLKESEKKDKYLDLARAMTITIYSTLPKAQELDLHNRAGRYLWIRIIYWFIWISILILFRAQTFSFFRCLSYFMDYIKCPIKNSENITEYNRLSKKTDVYSGQCVMSRIIKTKTHFWMNQYKNRLHFAVLYIK